MDILHIQPEEDTGDWYCTLRAIQGNLDSLYEMYKRTGVAYMTDGSDFIQDSLFCEHAYIINLDTENLEYWIGFQKEPDEDNRYGCEVDPDNGEYYPCRFILEIPLIDMYKSGILSNLSHEDKRHAIEEYVTEMESTAERIQNEDLWKKNADELDDLVDLIESNNNWGASVEEDNTIILTASPEAEEQEFVIDIDPDMDTLVDNIIDELDRFDEDDYAIDRIYGMSSLSISDIRYVCDVAEEISEMCEDLADCLRREYVYAND